MNTAAILPIDLSWTIPDDVATPFELVPSGTLPSVSKADLSDGITTSPYLRLTTKPSKDVAPDPQRSNQTGLLASPFARMIPGRVDRSPKQTIFHYWECSVERIDGESFIATLRSLRDDAESEKEAEIPLDEISPDDLELLAPGAIFYWSIGYETSPAGTRKRFSSLRFRRLPAWNRKDLARVEAAGKDLFKMFGQDNDARDAASAE
jgi:hypothetical protein